MTDNEFVLLHFCLSPVGSMDTSASACRFTTKSVIFARFNLHLMAVFTFICIMSCFVFK